MIITLIVEQNSKKRPIGEKFPGCTTIKDLQKWVDEICVEGIHPIELKIPLFRKSKECEICGILFEEDKKRIDGKTTCSNCEH